MLIELDIIADVYGPGSEEGQPKLIKEGIIYKRLFDTNQIKAEEYINAKGRIVKSWVNIIEGENTYRAKHKYSDIVAKLLPLQVKGFIVHGKKKSYIKS